MRSTRPLKLRSPRVRSSMTLPRRPGWTTTAGLRTMRRSRDRKSTRLNSSHAEIYTLSLHDALPIYKAVEAAIPEGKVVYDAAKKAWLDYYRWLEDHEEEQRSEEHTSELQSRRDLHSFPTRRSSDLQGR